jgi:predicted translation initiation factor SUI1
MPFTIGGDYIPEESLPKPKKPLKVIKEKRKNTFLTLVQNLNYNDSELKSLAQELKKHLACGGSVKNGVIELQGDKVEQVNKFLIKKGIKNA